LSARPTWTASDPVSVRQVAVWLHASFRRRLTTSPLRFASTSPPSGCAEDLHPQAVEHARHTSKPLRGRQTRCSHTQRYCPPPLTPVPACGSLLGVVSIPPSHIRPREGVGEGVGVRPGSRFLGSVVRSHKSPICRQCRQDLFVGVRPIVTHHVVSKPIADVSVAGHHRGVHGLNDHGACRLDPLLEIGEEHRWVGRLPFSFRASPVSR
jgi:hypothetical protein